MSANLKRIEESLLPEAPLVLVVDDEGPICESFVSVLLDEGYQTLIAKNGPEALSLTQKYRPQVVFLDIWMPGWDGLVTLEKIKEASPETQVIMISGHATISNAIEATKRGAFDFIEKPLDIETIIASLSRALEEFNKSSSQVPAKAIHEKLALNPHKGILSQGLKGKNLGQRTLKRSTILYGHCLHSGKKSGLVLEPLPVNSGIHFAKIGDSKSVPAFVDYVDSTSFATRIKDTGVSAGTIEHLMSALHAYGISNLLIKCNEEVPILDGSAIDFCKVIDSVGIEEQGGEWFEIAPTERLEFRTPSGELISVTPAEQLTICYELDYPEPVGKQTYEFVYTGVQSFKNEIAPCRTFGFMKDVERLQKAGLAAGGRLDNFVLIGTEGIVNTELRFPEELARHKVLDAIGDLFLIGRPLRARVHARMTGHSDNIELLRLIAQTAV